MTEAAEKEDSMAQQLDNLEAQVRPFCMSYQHAATQLIKGHNYPEQCIPSAQTIVGWKSGLASRLALALQVNRIVAIQELLAKKLLDQASYESLPKEVKSGE